MITSIVFDIEGAIDKLSLYRHRAYPDVTFRRKTDITGDLEYFEVLEEHVRLLASYPELRARYYTFQLEDLDFIYELSPLYVVRENT